MKKILAGVMVLLCMPVVAKEHLAHYSQRDFGGVGLLQMPTARMNPTGEFTFFANRTRPYTRFGVSAQPLDWFEILFRYTDVANRLYGPSIAGTQSYKDKAVDVKFRLKQESYYWPQLALGIQDVAGTGLFSSEYLVASKRWRNFDFTLGFAWGYLGSRGGITNPLTLFGKKFKKRSAFTGQGGEFSFKNYFRGKEIGLFGGVEYHPKWAPRLTLKLEVDGNDYQHEPQQNNQPQRTPVNVGAVWRLSPGVELYAGYERGHEVMFGFSMGTNFNHSPPQPKLHDPKPAKVGRVSAGSPSWPKVARRLRKEAGWKVHAIDKTDHELIVRGEQERFLDTPKALGRGARILSQVADDHIKWFSFELENRGLSLAQASVQRDVFERAARHELAVEDALRSAQLGPPESKGKRVFEQPEEPFRYEIGPGLSQVYGGPDGFFLYQLRLDLSGEWRLARNKWFSGTLMAGLVDNFDRFHYTAPSNLPRVRTYLREFLTTSRVRLDNLQYTQVADLGGGLYAMGYLGYLETMYAGLGGELLYRPFSRPWALGVDLNAVRQRDFNVHFGLRGYKVLTGHATLYYRLPWVKGAEFQLSAGRYLAGDHGATIQLSRTFDNNVTLGAWATFTDVSAAQFGEGSFDKGFFIKIPFDFFFTQSSTRQAEIRWSFLTRDGGQKLWRRYNLYDLTEGRDQYGFQHRLGTLME